MSTPNSDIFTWLKNDLNELSNRLFEMTMTNLRRVCCCCIGEEEDENDDDDDEKEEPIL